MPISHALAANNRSQTDRLRALVAPLDEAAFGTRLCKGWTVSGILAHIAFWYRQRLCMMRRWAEGDWCSGSYDGNLFNETMRPLLELIPGNLAAGAALHAAEEVDAFLLRVPDDVVERALARPDVKALLAPFRIPVADADANEIVFSDLQYDAVEPGARPIVLSVPRGGGPPRVVHMAPGVQPLVYLLVIALSYLVSRRPATWR